jgi:hypothetical protein
MMETFGRKAKRIHKSAFGDLGTWLRILRPARLLSNLGTRRIRQILGANLDLTCCLQFDY